MCRKVLHVDENHPVLLEGLEALGYENVLAYETPVETLLKELSEYEGLVIRSRFPIDESVLDSASNLRFIARVGAGLENIDTAYAAQKNIELIAAPEGNRNAVGEHCLGMLLCLLNKLHTGNQSVKAGHWEREAQRGWELKGKTVGLIGYGNTGKSFARKLSGFGVDVLCYDIQASVGDDYATQVSLSTLQEKAEVLSLHTPETAQTQRMINHTFIRKMKHPFWLLNTARGSVVVTADLVTALQSGKVRGAGLDVLEYESRSFTTAFHEILSESLQYLTHAENVLLSPHVAGWTVESHRKLAALIVEKVTDFYHSA